MKKIPQKKVKNAYISSLSSRKWYKPFCVALTILTLILFFGFSFFVGYGVRSCNNKQSHVMNVYADEVLSSSYSSTARMFTVGDVPLKITQDTSIQTNLCGFYANFIFSYSNVFNISLRYFDNYHGDYAVLSSTQNFSSVGSSPSSSDWVDLFIEDSLSLYYTNRTYYQIPIKVRYNLPFVSASNLSTLFSSSYFRISLDYVDFNIYRSDSVALVASSTSDLYLRYVCSDPQYYLEFCMPSCFNDEEFTFYDGDISSFYVLHNQLNNQDYQQGYDIGYNDGYSQKGYDEYQNGFKVGYDEGYNNGLNESFSNISPFSALVSGIDSFMQIRIFGTSVTLGLILSLSFGLVLLGIALKVFFHS